MRTRAHAPNTHLFCACALAARAGVDGRYDDFSLYARGTICRDCVIMRYTGWCGQYYARSPAAHITRRDQRDRQAGATRHAWSRTAVRPCGGRGGRVARAHSNALGARTTCRAGAVQCLLRCQCRRPACRVSPAAPALTACPGCAHRQMMHSSALDPRVPAAGGSHPQTPVVEQMQGEEHLALFPASTAALARTQILPTYATLGPRDLVCDQVRALADASVLGASPDVHAAVEGRGAREREETRQRARVTLHSSRSRHGTHDHAAHITR